MKTWHVPPKHHLTFNGLHSLVSLTIECYKNFHWYVTKRHIILTLHANRFNSSGTASGIYSGGNWFKPLPGHLFTNLRFVCFPVPSGKFQTNIILTTYNMIASFQVFSNPLFTQPPVQSIIHPASCPIHYSPSILSNPLFTQPPVQSIIHQASCAIHYSPSLLSNPLYTQPPVQSIIHPASCPIHYSPSLLSNPLLTQPPVQSIIHPDSCPIHYSPSILSNVYGGLFTPRVKRWSRKPDHWTPTTAKVKNTWIYISIPHTSLLRSA
jgi:hypothetical protein